MVQLQVLSLQIIKKGKIKVRGIAGAQQMDSFNENVKLVKIQTSFMCQVPLTLFIHGKVEVTVELWK